METSQQRPICPGCGNEIDPEVCWCGDYIKNHGSYDGHSPVPMGCDCGRDKEEDISKPRCTCWDEPGTLNCPVCPEITMEEIAQCKCGGLPIWTIYQDRVECVNCGKQYKWSVEAPIVEQVMAKDIIRLVNDNH